MAISAFCMYPASKTRTALYHNSKLKIYKFMITDYNIKQKKWSDYQTITPDDMESFTRGITSLNAAKENPVHVSGHQPPKM